MGPRARSKFGASMFEPEVFRKQMFSIEESTCDIVRIFRCPPQWFRAPIVIRRPGNRAPLVTPLYRPVARFQDLVEHNIFLGGHDFCFYSMFKTIFCGCNRIWGWAQKKHRGGLPPNALPWLRACPCMLANNLPVSDKNALSMPVSFSVMDRIVFSWPKNIKSVIMS